MLAPGSRSEHSGVVRDPIDHDADCPICGGRVTIGDISWIGEGGDWSYTQAGDCGKCDASLVRAVEPLDPDSAEMVAIGEWREGR